MHDQTTQPSRQTLQLEQDLFTAICDLRPDQQKAFLESLGQNGDCPHQRVKNQVSRLLAAECTENLIDHLEEGLPLGNQPQVGSRVGNYQIIKKVAQGGMGIIYQAIDHGSQHGNRIVALKFPAPGANFLLCRQHLMHEAQVIANFKHPNIIGLIESDTDEFGNFFLVLEWIDGTPLNDYFCGDFVETRSIELTKRLQVFLACCRSVAAVHQQGFVHCDLKPENILLIDRDGVIEPKIIDFGIAQPACKAAPFTESTNPLSHFTATGNPQHTIRWNRSCKETLSQRSSSCFGSERTGLAAIGTINYMSPEQLSGGRQPIDFRSDVFSLGCILHGLVIDHSPQHWRPTVLIEANDSQWPKSTQRFNCISHPTKTSDDRPLPRPEALAEVNSGQSLNIDPAVRQVVSRSLAENCCHRYPNAHALANAIEQILVVIGQGVTQG